MQYFLKEHNLPRYSVDLFFLQCTRVYLYGKHVLTNEQKQRKKNLEYIKSLFFFFLHIKFTLKPRHKNKGTYWTMGHLHCYNPLWVHIYGYLCFLNLRIFWSALPLQSRFPGILGFLELDVIINWHIHDDLPGWEPPWANAHKLRVEKKHSQCSWLLILFNFYFSFTSELCRF